MTTTTHIDHAEYDSMTDTMIAYEVTEDGAKEHKWRGIAIADILLECGERVEGEKVVFEDGEWHISEVYNESKLSYDIQYATRRVEKINNPSLATAYEMELFNIKNRA